MTKDGNLAGPKVLEHVVDTVLYFEGAPHHAHRIVRAVKNRFGAASELGVFEMTGNGLAPVAESLAALPRRAAEERTGLVGAVHDRRVAADSRRGAGARERLDLRQRATDGERSRSQPPVAAPRGARQARRSEPRDRRRLRERRGRDDASRSRPPTSRSSRPSRRACATGRLRPTSWCSAKSGWPARSGRRRRPRCAPRGRPPRVHALRAPRRQSRQDRRAQGPRADPSASRTVGEALDVDCDVAGRRDGTAGPSDAATEPSNPSLVPQIVECPP